MWKCKKCQESLDDNFDTCWNCGLSKDGKHQDSNFNLVRETAPNDDPHLKNIGYYDFQCPKCKFKQCKQRSIRSANNKLASALDIQNTAYTVLICQKCYLVQMYKTIYPKTIVTMDVTKKAFSFLKFFISLKGRK